MKIVFLDFDGVLNNIPWLTSGRRAAREGLDSESDVWEALTFDPGCIDQLNRIVSETGAAVVISSAWRYNRTIAELWDILDGCGFEGDVIGKTRPSRRFENGSWEPRGAQIVDWLEVGRLLFGVEVESFVILDDQDHIGEALAPFTVLTTRDGGLTIEEADRAIRILNGSLSRRTSGGLLDGKVEA